MACAVAASLIRHNATRHEKRLSHLTHYAVVTLVILIAVRCIVLVFGHLAGAGAGDVHAVCAFCA